MWAAIFQFRQDQTIAERTVLASSVTIAFVEFDLLPTQSVAIPIAPGWRRSKDFTD
jgi:hypothetical protein